MIDIRFLDLDNEYEIVENWWLERDMTPIPKEALSDFGLIAFNTETNEPVAAYWLFPIMCSKMCLHLFFISDKDSSKDERDKALDALLEGTHNIAKNLGYEHMMTTTATPPIEARLKKYNYVLGDTNINQFWGRF